MAHSRHRTSGIFPGLVLITVGVLLLLHNYRGLELGDVLLRWWPLALIFLGLIKIYDRTVASRSDDPGAARITGGEILLVVGMLVLLSCVVAVDYGRRAIGGKLPIEISGDSYPFDLDVAPKPVPENARITIRGGHGDIIVRATDVPEIRVAGKKNVHAWSENDASRRAGPVSVEIVQNGDGYEIHPTGVSAGDSRITVDMEIQVPKKASVTVRNEKGDITVSDMATTVSITSANGDVEVRDTASDVNIEMHKGDVKVSDTKGDIKISGKGTQVDVASATGSFTLDGEFYGPIRARQSRQRSSLHLPAHRSHAHLAHRPHGSQLRQSGNRRRAGRHCAAHQPLFRNHRKCDRQSESRQPRWRRRDALLCPAQGRYRRHQHKCQYLADSSRIRKFQHHQPTATPAISILNFPLTP